MAKEKTPLLDKYKACLNGNTSKQDAVARVDAYFNHLSKQDGGGESIEDILSKIGEFKKSRSGWFGGSANREQERLLIALDNSIGESLLSAHDPKFTRENILTAIFVLMKNASGNATIPQALQAIFDKYRAHFKALNRGARFIDKNLNRGRGDKYINPALPSAPIVAAAGGGPKSIGDITKGENLTNRYLSNDQLFGSKGTETRSYEVYRYQGGVYAWDGVRPALLWQSAKHVQGVSTIRQIGTGSMGAINLKEKNPSKVVKTLHGFRGDEFALYKGRRLHLYNNSLISMKYACMDHGIEDIFKIGLWNLKNGVDYKEDITYNMPFVKGRELRGEARKIRFSSVLYGNPGHAGTWFWKGLAGRFESFPVVRKMMFVRLRRDLNPLALTMAA